MSERTSESHTEFPLLWKLLTFSSQMWLGLSFFCNLILTQWFSVRGSFAHQGIFGNAWRRLWLSPPLSPEGRCWPLVCRGHPALEHPAALRSPPPSLSKRSSDPQMLIVRTLRSPASLLKTRWRKCSVEICGEH